jgi:hypothetical protein
VNFRGKRPESYRKNLKIPVGILLPFRMVFLEFFFRIRWLSRLFPMGSAGFRRPESSTWVIGILMTYMLFRCVRKNFPSLSIGWYVYTYVFLLSIVVSQGRLLEPNDIE